MSKSWMSRTLLRTIPVLYCVQAIIINLLRNDYGAGQEQSPINVCASVQRGRTEGLPRTLAENGMVAIVSLMWRGKLYFPTAAD